MKKAAILTLTSFYLLLTTGMFVCLVHCFTQNVVNITTHYAAGSRHAGMAMSHHSKSHHKNGNECNCCNKHGNYVIKENFKPAFNFNLAKAPIITFNTPLFRSLLVETQLTPINLWTYTHGPPGKSGKMYLIQIQTLLI